MSERSIFLAALDITDPAKRSAYLDQACAGDAALRKHLDGLIAAEGNLGSFLNRPPSALDVTQDRQPLERPGSQIGPYKLREQIGEGGFGVVYVAEQERPVRRKVALKIIKPGMDTKDVIARFEAERQALALMDHPNVARVLDAGATDSGRPYFVMELVHGVPVTEFCDKSKVPTRERLSLFADVCRAVQHAHQKGIIHRDLKPSNIMVTLHDGKPVVKVIDFGVSKALSQQLTEKSIYTAYGQMIGTPSYMSPEQAEMSGLGIDTRSDIYSLGVLLYELLTGKTPLDLKRLREGGYGEMLRMIREEEPLKPSLCLTKARSAELGIPTSATSGLFHRLFNSKSKIPNLKSLAELDWIVMKCLEKDRSRRYETAIGLARDVERYLQDEPVEACPPSVVYRVRKFAGKHKASLTAAAAFLALLLTGIFVATWQRNVAVRAAHTARLAKEAEAKQRQLAEASEHTALQERNNALATKEELRHTLYAAEMNLTQVAWDNKQFGRVEQLLKEQPADLRGFEWHYWQRKLRRGRLQSLQIPRLNASSHYRSDALASSRDGQRLATILDYPDEKLNEQGFGLLAIFDGTTGRELITPVDPFPDWREGQNKFRRLAMSEDGSRLAVTLSRTGEARPTYKPFDRISIRDGKTGQQIRLIQNVGLVSDLALSPDGSRVAVHGSDAVGPLDMPQRSYRIWDTSTGELIATLPTLPRDLPCLTFSPDGTRILRRAVLGESRSNSPGNIFQVVDVASGQEIWRREIKDAGTLGINIWVWSPDGKYVVAAHSLAVATVPNLQLWDGQTGRTLAILERESESPINRYKIDFSEDGRQLAALSTANEIYVWELSDLTSATAENPLRIAAPHLTLCTGGEEIRSLRFSADGQKLHTAGQTSLATWDATLREDQGCGPGVSEFYGNYSIRFNAISPDCTRLALSNTGLRTESGWATEYAVWDLATDQEVCRLKTEDGSPGSPTFHPDGKRIASTKRARAPEENLQIIMHDVQTGEAVDAISAEKSDGWLGLLHFRPDGKQLAALASAGLRAEISGPVRRERRLVAWDTTTKRQSFSVDLQLADDETLQLMGYSPDGLTLILQMMNADFQRDSALLLFDAATGKEQKSIRLPGTLRPMAVDFPRKRIIAAIRPVEDRFFSYGHTDVVVLDLETGRERVRLRGHGGFEHFEITPDGSRIILANPPVSIRGASTFSVWSLTSGRRLLEFNRQGPVSALGLSPDGHRLVATFSRLANGTNHKPIQIWDATPLPNP